MFQTIDLHCDTIWKLYEKGGSLKSNKFHIDEQKLIKGGAAAQFFAVFIDMKDRKFDVDEGYLYAGRLIEKFKHEIGQCDRLNFAASYEDLMKNRRRNMVSAFLTIEESGIINNDLKRIDELYSRGVRLMTLTWNHPNSIGYPNKEYKYSGLGLTEFGREAVEYMAYKGILVDVSHLSDKGVQDVDDTVKNIFIASHSNCRSVHDHPRNLTDAMIRRISDNGGIIGINYAAHFLSEKKTSHIDDICIHLRHLKKTGGIECCAIGGDLDGISSTLEFVDYSGIGQLYERMKGYGFSSNEVDKIAHDNAMRVIKDVF